MCLYKGADYGMKIEYLREFVLLAQNLNFSATAERLYITQSVLSRHISSMEAELGVSLLDRNTKSVELTEAGVFFLRRIEGILSDYDRLTVELLMKNRAYRHMLRLGINYYSFGYYLGSVPQYIQEHYPATLLSYTTGSPDELIGYLFSGEVDAIITSRIPFARSNLLQFFDIFREPLFVLMPTTHPLASRSSLTLGELAGETFIGVDTNVYATMWELLSASFARIGADKRLERTYRQPEEVSIAVRHGEGLFIEGDLVRHLRNDATVCVPLSGEGLERTISIASRKALREPAILQLIEAYQSLCPNGAAPPIV